VERAQSSFEDALEKAQRIVSGLVNRMHSIHKSVDPPDQLQIAFGLGLSAEAGAVLGAGAEANYKVSLTGTKTPDE